MSHVLHVKYWIHHPSTKNTATDLGNRFLELLNSKFYDATYHYFLVAQSLFILSCLSSVGRVCSCSLLRVAGLRSFVSDKYG